ncbi:MULTISPECIES: DsbA family oxidoreductase [Streptomycetaceae]|uniref:DsbA family oxidoreductase n=1 Tax=Streptomycetaceae TaxID=2062 RepID=UPI000213F9D1|nr:DsbA family protein [Streptantibioticus cattleyicolor]MYS62546.1 thioredoxin domain-containing protein [Streptomyces sp. SID5468]CCB78475.1 putative Predicted dithiol-disulfide isomerase involved in polyketide biosynthesis [Streptantibioticus cattleyicolor NRRL 8057 = DSM 46488]
MPVTVDVWFDYICPFSLIARRVVAGALADRDRNGTGNGDGDGTVDGEGRVEVCWRPFELNPDCAEEAGEYPRGVWENSVLPLAARYGVALGRPPGRVLRRSRAAFTGYQYAAEHGAGTAYNDLVFSAYFQQGMDISDTAVLALLAGRVGLDRRDFRAALGSPRYTDRHLRAVAEARRVDRVSMVPTVAIGSWRVEGVPSTEQIQRALAGARARQTPAAL